jgi:hypothetical protein
MLKVRKIKHIFEFYIFKFLWILLFSLKLLSLVAFNASNYKVVANNKIIIKTNK